MSCTVLVYGVAKGRGPIPARTSVCRVPHIEIKNAPPGRFHHSCGAERPNCNRPRSGHLSGRVAAPTRVGEAGGSRNLTGAPPPQALFFGAPPRFFGQDQRNGVDKQHNLKSSRTNRRVPPTHPPGGLFTFLVLGDAICNKKTRAVWRAFGRDGHFRCLLNLWCQENGTNKNLEHIQWGNIFIIIRFLSFNIWMFATSKPFTSCQPNFVIIKPLYCPRNNSFRQKHI